MHKIKTFFDKIIILFFILTLFPVYASDDKTQLDILSIHSYHQDYPWTSLQYEAFRKQITHLLPDYKLNFLTEYLDTKHIPPSESYQETFLNYINIKYKNHIPDILYVTDDNALNFMISDKMKFTWQIPIVFSGINNSRINLSHIKQPIMGVFEYKDIQSSILLAKKIQADLSRIVLLGDAGATDNAINVSMINDEYKVAGVEVIHLSNPHLNTLIKQIKNIDSSIILLTSIGGFQDEQGLLLDLKQIIDSITKTGKIILVMEDSYLLPGVLGGYITSGYIQGSSAAYIISNFIEKGVTENSKKVQTNASELILNWPVLQFFNLDLPAQLLDQAKIMNQPVSVESKYSFLVKLLMLFVLILLIILFVSVFITRRNNILLQEQNTDKLTGLNNRIKLLRDINMMSCPNLMVCNINNFKSINHLYGLEVGDKLLNKFVQKAQKYIDKNTSFYRIGGNKFAILSNHCHSTLEFDRYIIDFFKNIQKDNYHIDQLDINLTLTAGISRNEHELLIPMAEQALQKAKDDNKDYYTCDAQEDDAVSHKNNLVWAQKLGDALSNDRIVPYFQSITHNKTGKQDKYEALVRLIDENDEIITPFHFLDAAKNTRKYATLTKVMVEKTLQAIKKHPEPISISINFTVNDIRDEATIDFFIRKIREYKVADRIIVELTESEGIENYHQVADFFKQIKKMGCRVAIDDFGTGYSNFTHLIHLNVDYLKIDGSIIQNIIDDKNAEIVVRTIVDFASQLGIETIAEFVDSQIILDKVTELGIDYSQGYFLGKPEKKLPV